MSWLRPSFEINQFHDALTQVTNPEWFKDTDSGLSVKISRHVLGDPGNFPRSCRATQRAVAAFQEVRAEPNGGARRESEIRPREKERAAIGCVKKAADENNIVGTGRWPQMW